MIDGGSDIAFSVRCYSQGYFLMGYVFWYHFPYRQNGKNIKCIRINEN